MRNKVLMIGFLQPYTYAGGSFRLLPLATHFKELGWEPVVLTPHLFEKVDLPFRIVETGYQDILHFWQRLFRFEEKETFKQQAQQRIGNISGNKVIEFLFNRAGEIINYPDPYRGWKPFALETGRQLLRDESFDVLFSCHPAVSHIIAHKLKQEYDIPWVADLPDLWSRNHNYRYSPVRRLFDTRLEKRTFRNADVLTTVSEPWADKLRDLHKSILVETVQHGFPLDELNDPPVRVTRKFTLTYTGTLYKDGQDLNKLFLAVKELISEGKIDRNDVELRFYGPVLPWLDATLVKHGISDLAKQHGKVSHKEAVARQCESQVLVFAKWKSYGDVGTYAYKIYEYLAARRPILAVDGRHDVVTDLLEETQAGIDALEYDTVKHTLLKLYREYKKNGEILFHGKTEEIRKHSHREMAIQFLRLIESLSDIHSAPEHCSL